MNAVTSLERVLPSRVGRQNQHAVGFVESCSRIADERVAVQIGDERRVQPAGGRELGKRREASDQGGQQLAQGVRLQVQLGDAEIHLSPKEYSLLRFLVSHAGRVVTHQQLLKEVWGPESMDQHHYLRVYMGQLRHKLEADPARPRFLMTETGVGYRLQVD